MASIRHYLVLGSIILRRILSESKLGERKGGLKIERLQRKRQAACGRVFPICSDLRHQTQRFADLEQLGLLDTLQLVQVKL